jgi:hypothetical protein
MLLGSLALSIAAPLTKGTEVLLTFKQALSSKTAKAGQLVNLEVEKDVADSSGSVVLHKGDPVTATIVKVDKRDHFGKNARIRLSIQPVHGVELEPRDKGKLVGGTRSDQAGAVAGAGLLVLGPLGLAGGYFVVGHPVNIKAGDELRTEVSAPQ